eukprot:Gb_40894 [translate_table: standard]
MTPYTSIMGAIASEYLGLLNYSNNGKSYNHIFIIEFDTNDNVDFVENNNNHVSVDLKSLESVESKHVGYFIRKSFKELNIKSGDNIQSWINCNHTLDQLNINITLVGLDRLVNLLISVRNIGLFSVLKENMYVGFSVAIGFDTIEDHYILS